MMFPRSPKAMLALLWVALGLSLGAQSLAFRRFDHRDGLPQSQVSSLLEDRQGFIWVGTYQGGVARLGPSGFITFGPNQGLQGKTVSTLLEDRQGYIWVATQDGGAAKIRGTEVVNYGPDQGLMVKEVFSLGEDAQGRILAGTRSGLFRMEGTRFKGVPLPGEWAGAAIFSMAVDDRGGIWLGGHKGKLARWDGTSLSAPELPAGWSDETVQDLRKDPTGHVWALQSKQLIRMNDKAAWEAIPLDVGPSVKLHGLSFDAQGRMVLAMESDGLMIREPDGRSRKLTSRNGLPRDRINTGLLDRRGDLWVGSDGAGLAVQVVPCLQVLAEQPETGANLGLGAIARLLELGPGELLLGGSNGLFRWKEGRGILNRWAEEEGLPSTEVWALINHRKGGVWVGTNKGMVRWLNGKLLKEGPKELEEAAVVCLLYHQNRLWAGTDRGLFELDEDGRFLHRYRPPEEVGPESTYDLLPFGSGLLVGTSLGLYDFREGRFTRQLPKAPFANLSINSLNQDSQGTIWVGTPQGLFGLPREGPGEHIKVLGREQGLLDDTISWSRELPDGTLAVGHGSGISLVRDGRVIPVTNAQGLISNETNHESALVDSQGRLWFGMIGGACVLDPRVPIGEFSLPPPQVLEVISGTRIHWLPTSLSLPPRPESLTFVFDTGLPVAPAHPTYQVLLEGADDTWRAADSQNPLLYLRPAPGHYRFRVRASLDGQHWVEGEPVLVDVEPAWFQRRSIQALLLFAALGLVGLVARWRYLRFQRREDELEYWVQERTASLAHRTRDLEQAHAQIKRSLEDRMQLLHRVAHDLRSPLTSIMLSVDRLRDTTDGVGGAGEMLSLVERETGRLESILRTLLDQAKAESLFEALKLQPFSPVELLEGISGTLGLKAEAKGLSCELTVDPASERVKVRVDLTAMLQVLFNLVENALKFTAPGGCVGIRSKVDQDRWILEVWDTGRGMSLKQLGRIFEPFKQNEADDSTQGWGLGLSICRALVKAQGGDLTVESTEGEGSTFRVSLPLLK